MADLQHGSVWQGSNNTPTESKGVYPQSDGGLVIVGTDASKGFIALWVHLFVAIEGIHRNGYQQKRYFIGFDQIQPCLVFTLRWACLPIKIGRDAQSEHLFSMYFDDLLTIYLIFKSMYFEYYFDHLHYFLV